MPYFDKDKIRLARQSDLSACVLKYHPDLFLIEGHTLRFKPNTSIVIKVGFCGYNDFATGVGGNSIDFLVDHLNYDFTDAVEHLLGIPGTTSPTTGNAVEFILPQASPSFAAVEKYLISRSIDKGVLNLVDSQNLIYQDIRNNAVFVSADRDFCELRGTYLLKPFHQVLRKSPECFWSFSPENVTATHAFICESAIDALSLFSLHLIQGEYNSGYTYCSIAGVENQKAIEKIARWCEPVIAVDNDTAGERCRKRNSDRKALIPKLKDWNEDLIAYMEQLRSEPN